MHCDGLFALRTGWGAGESEKIKWGSLMMMRLDVARQTVSSCCLAPNTTYAHKHISYTFAYFGRDTHALSSSRKHKATPFLIV